MATSAERRQDIGCVGLPHNLLAAPSEYLPATNTPTLPPCTRGRIASDIPCYYVRYATSCATSPAHAAFPIPIPPFLHHVYHPLQLCLSPFLFPPRSPSDSHERRIRSPNRRRCARTMPATSCTRTRPRHSLERFRSTGGGKDGHRHCEDLACWERTTRGRSSLVLRTSGLRLESQGRRLVEAGRRILGQENGRYFLRHFAATRPWLYGRQGPGTSIDTWKSIP
ncbi:hypothetical protein C8F01DRAFT_798806 [Mycena amicta]|nr:hypothetical protein C8F01DRAFT_798806 [Mycena amicta]